MDLTTGALPIFLTKNYVNSDVVLGGGVLTASSMQAFVSRVVDMDPFSIWQSATADDSTTETIDIALYAGVSQVLRQDIALIALLNINFKSFTIALSDDNGASFHTTYTVTDNSLTNYILDISSGVKTANFIRITATTTIVANAYKYLGTVVAAGLIHQLTNCTVMSIDRGSKDTEKVLEMSDGSQNITRIKRSAASYSFYTASIKLKYVPQTELVYLQAIKRENPEFIFYAEPGDITGEMFWCRFDGPIKSRYSTSNKAFGYDVPLAVIEVQ